MTSYGTITTSGTTLSLAPTTGSRPSDPAGLIVTNVAHTLDGYFGQVIVDKVIVWQSQAYGESKDAMEEANEYVVSIIRSLFEPKGKPKKKS